MTDSSAPTRLNDCTQGDMVVVRWEDHGTRFNGTEQIVVYCGPIGHGNSKANAQRLKKHAIHEQWAIVELVDPTTMQPYPHGVIRRFNAFILPNLAVVELVRPSKYGRLNKDAARSLKNQGDVDDPMQRRE